MENNSKRVRANYEGSKIDYMHLAREKGAACGKYVATLKTLHDQDSATITKAAIQFVNSLPLNDLAFESQLQSEFENTALHALRS